MHLALRLAEEFGEWYAVLGQSTAHRKLLRKVRRIKECAENPE
jgi:hypothetical protein